MPDKCILVAFGTRVSARKVTVKVFSSAQIQIKITIIVLIGLDGIKLFVTASMIHEPF